MSLESACIASGISYIPATDEKSEEFNSIKHGEILKSQTTSDAAEAIQAWNMRTQFFLKRFVMMRVMDRSKPKGKI